MIEIFSGRPETKRSIIEEKVYDTLENLKIDFKRVDHAPAANIEICHGIEKHLGATICKNIFLTNNKRDIFCLLLISPDKKYEAGKISKQLNSSRLSFASDQLLSDILGLTPGSVSIMGLINDVNHKVTLAIDSDLMNEEYLCCHPCINTSTLKIKTTDILEKFIPHTGHPLNIIET